MTWLSDIGDYLQTAGYGTVGASIHFYNFDSLTQNDVALIPFSTGEYNRVVSKETTNPKPGGLEVAVRNSDAETAFNKVTSIYELLRTVSNQYIGSTKFIYIVADASPGFVSESAGNSFIFTVNFSLLIQ